MDIVEWFKLLTELEPTEDQIAFLKDCIDKGLSKIIISAGRQSGKTLCSAVAVLWFVFEYPEPLKILLISAQQNVLYLHILDIFRKMKDKDRRFSNAKSGGEIVEETPWNVIPLRGFTTTRGTIVYVRGSTDKQVRGLPADIVVIDEACEIKNDIILTAMGNLSGEVSKFVMLSTPHVSTSLFVEWATEDEPTFKVHQWSSEGLRWHKEDIQNEKKKRMSKEKYAVEVLGRPPTKSERSFFPSKHIDKCASITEEEIREGGANSRVEVGIDFGKVTVLVVTERIGTTVRKILRREIWKNAYPEMVGPKILKVISEVKPYVSKGDNKPKEYMEWFNKNARGKIKFIDFSLGHKEQMFGQLQRMVREHRLILPPAFPDIIAALRKYRYRPNEEAKIAGSDLVEALALSIYEPSVPLTGDTYGKIYFPDIK